MTHYAIRTESLVKTYSKLQAVNGLNLNVPEGSIYGLLGRNSSGKTTTIRMAMGLARPTSGTIRVFGLDPGRDPERVKVLSQVGYVPEDKAILGLSIRKLLSLNRGFYSNTWSDELARKVVDRLELDLDQPMVKLSLGNKTKASLACAIAQRSRLLILDEPTTGLDPIALDELLRLIVEDCTQDGRTVFLSSHQLTEIEQVADHIGIMDRGRLLIEGPLDEIRSSFRRVTVTGEALPSQSLEVLSSRPVGHARQYILRKDPERFVQKLSANGATIVDNVPLSLNEIFLELCRKRRGPQLSRPGSGGACMNALWSTLFILSPLPLLIFVGRLRRIWQQRAAAKEATEQTFFEPSPEPLPNRFTRHFTPIERLYIRQQAPTARVGFYIVSWLVLCAMAASLLPGTVHSYKIEQPEPIAVWYSYLRASVALGCLTTVIASITAILTGVALTGKLARTSFFLTRPITYRLIFWGRVVPALCALLAGYTAGLGASLVLLLAFYGPVWNHLDGLGLSILIKLSHSQELGWLLRSPWAIFVSVAASMIFVFCAVMVVILQPFRLPKMPKPVLYLVSLAASVTFSVLGAYKVLPTLAHLGLLPSLAMAPPPIWIDAFSISVSAMLLWLAQLAITRKEN